MTIIWVKPNFGYSWLEGRALSVYDCKESKFLVWDPVLEEWTWIPMVCCTGD